MLVILNFTSKSACKGTRNLKVRIIRSLHVFEERTTKDYIGVWEEKAKTLVGEFVRCERGANDVVGNGW